MADGSHSVEGQAQGDAGRPIRVAFAQWLRAFLTFAAIMILDPFGCSTGADRYSENLLMKLRAPFHNGGWWVRSPSDTAGQRQVLVVLVDQETLDEWAKSYTGYSERLTWPVSRTRQVDWLIAPLLRQQPAALFLDWTFHQDSLGEGGEADTRSARDRLREELAPVPGVLSPRLLLGMRAEGDAPAPGCTVQWATPDGLARRFDIASMFTAWPPDADVEFVSLLRYDRAQYATFPVRLRDAAGGPQCAASAAGHVHLAAPAVAMFHQWCAREGKRDDGLCRDFGPEARVPLDRRGDAAEMSARFAYRAPEALTNHMTLAWPGLRTSEQRARDDWLARRFPESPYAGYISACRTSGETPAGLFLSLLSSAASDRGAGEGCRYGVDWISFAQFDDLIAEGRLSLANRYVLVSPDLPSVPDRVASSLHGEAPGVFLHAIALENLISRGEAYLQDPPGLRGLSLGGLYTLLLGAIVALAVPRFSRLLDTDRTGFAIGIALIGALLPLVVGVQLTACQDLAPIGWVSLMAASAWIIDEFVESKVIRPGDGTATRTGDPLADDPRRRGLRATVLLLVGGSLVMPCQWSGPMLWLGAAGLVGLVITRARQGEEQRDLLGLSPWLSGFVLPAVAVTAITILIAMIAGTDLSQPIGQ